MFQLKNQPAALDKAGMAYTLPVFLPWWQYALALMGCLTSAHLSLPQVMPAFLTLGSRIMYLVNTFNLTWWFYHRYYCIEGQARAHCFHSPSNNLSLYICNNPAYFNATESAFFVWNMSSCKHNLLLKLREEVLYSALTAGEYTAGVWSSSRV